MAGVAGCAGPLGGIADGDGDGDGDEDDPGDLLYDDVATSTIEPGNFVPYRFSLDRVATLTYSLTVVSGPTVDLVATADRYVEAFAEGGDWQFYDPASVADTATASVEAVLDPGEWALILDNSRQGRANPWRETPTGTPPDWRSGAASPTPEGRPATVRFEYAVRAGGATPGATATGPGARTGTD